jgi:hypothetical protein
MIIHVCYMYYSGRKAKRSNQVLKQRDKLIERQVKLKSECNVEVLQWIEIFNKLKSF